MHIEFNTLALLQTLAIRAFGHGMQQPAAAGGRLEASGDARGVGLSLGRAAGNLSRPVRARHESGCPILM